MRGWCLTMMRWPSTPCATRSMTCATSCARSGPGPGNLPRSPPNGAAARGASAAGRCPSRWQSWACSWPPFPKRGHGGSCRATARLCPSPSRGPIRLRPTLCRPHPPPCRATRRRIAPRRYPVRCPSRTDLYPWCARPSAGPTSACSGDAQADRGLPVVRPARGDPALRRRQRHHHPADRRRTSMRRAPDPATSARFSSASCASPPPQAARPHSCSGPVPLRPRSGRRPLLEKALYAATACRYATCRARRPRCRDSEYVLGTFFHWKDQQRLQEISHDAPPRPADPRAHGVTSPSGCRPPRGFRIQLGEIQRHGSPTRCAVGSRSGDLAAAEAAWRFAPRGASLSHPRECPGSTAARGVSPRFFATASTGANSCSAARSSPCRPW